MGVGACGCPLLMIVLSYFVIIEHPLAEEHQ